MNRLTLAIAFVLSLAACGGGSSAPGGGLDGFKAEAAGSPRVVVAVLDTAMNPYHEFFYHHSRSPLYADRPPSSVTQDVLDEIGVPPENVIEVTRTGNISRDVQTDKAIWDRVQVGKPYWFKGTNLIGVSYQALPGTRLVPDPAKHPHGVGTSATVLQANPDAVILFVEVDSLGSKKSHDLGFLHPAVDIVSTSYGSSVPNTGFPIPQVAAWLSTWDGVVQMGKLHFSSGGNGSGLTNKRAGAGPWWSIGVSGFEEDSSNGDQQALSGNFPDFVSDMTVEDVPYCQDCERGLSSVGGTSFSTPRAAGVASDVLLRARRALGHAGGIRLRGDGRHVMAQGGGTTITNWDLRRALEEAAYADYSVEDWDPVAAAGDLSSTPIITEAAWLQIGWGDLSANPEKGVVTAALAVLGFGGDAPAKDSAFCDFQTKVVEERKAYWDNFAVDAGDRAPPDPDPFVWCGSDLPSVNAVASPGQGSGMSASPGVAVNCTDDFGATPSHCTAGAN